MTTSEQVPSQSEPMLGARSLRADLLAALPLAAVLAAFAVVGRRIVWDEWLGARPHLTYLEALAPLDALLWLAIAAGLTIGLAALPRASELLRRCPPLFRAGDGRRVARGWWPAWSALMLLAWVPYLLVMWPGAIVGDSWASIGPMVGERALENHHPVFFTFFVGLFLRAAELIGVSINGGVAMFSFSQMVITAVALGWACRWLATRTSATVLTASLVAVFFAVVPVYPIFALNMQKDPLFGIALLLLCLHLGDLALTRGAAATPWFLMRLGLIALWASVWRNGGNLVVAASLVILFFVWRRAVWKPVIAGLVAVIIATGAISGIEAAGVKSAPTAEKLAIPLQQVARVVYEGQSLNPSEKATLEEILPLERWAELYTPARVDAVKWADDFDDEWLDAHSGEFLRTWVAIGTRSPDTYVAAWVLETFGFWSPGAKNPYGSFDTGVIENHFGIERAPKLDTVWGLTDDEWAEHFTFLGSGTLVWLLLISAFGVWRSPLRRALVAYAPLVLMWLAGLAATPAAFGLRYVYGIALALPFLVLAPVLARPRRGTCVPAETP